MKINKITVAVLAIVATLVFAIPSFASEVWIDFEGNGRSAAPATTFTKSSAPGGGTTYAGTYLPVNRVYANDDWFGVTGYLNFNLTPGSGTGSISILADDGKTPWLTASNLTSGVTVDKGGTTTTTTFTFTKGSALLTLTPAGDAMFKGAGFTIPSNLNFEGATLTVTEKSGGIRVTTSHLFATAVPEPTSLALFVPGIGLLGLIRRRFLA